MKQHHCRSIKKHSHECFTYNRVILPCQPRIRCDGTCFQRDFYQYPSYVYYPTWSTRPLPCNPLYRPSYFEKINGNPIITQQIQSFNQIVTTPITHLNNKDNFPSNNQYLPSVPSKKCVPKNNGLHVSSTSFIITNNDDQVINKESRMKDSQTFDTSVVTINSKNSIRNNEQHDNQSIQEKSKPSKSLHYNIPNELNMISSYIDSSNRPTLPSTIPPNIDAIKSSEILIKSITSIKNIERKSSINTSKSSFSLRNTRSTIDFGFLIDEISTENI